MDIKNFAARLFEKGKSQGFSDMEVYYTNAEAFQVNAFNQDIDKYFINTQSGLSFRGIFEGKMGYSFTEKYEEEDIEFLIENARQNSEEIQLDFEASIFEGSREYKKLENMELKDEDVKVKIQDALNMEKLALEKDKRIDSIEDCAVSTEKQYRRIINTKGLDVEEASGVAVAYISVVAREGEDVKSGFKFKFSSDYNMLNLNKIVDGAIEEGVSKLGAKTVDTGKYKVIFRNDAATNMLETFSSVFSGDSVQKGLSLLKGRIGERVSSPVITLSDDPFCEKAPVRCSFDDEGVATSKKTIIEKGELKTFLHNLKTSGKEGIASTGNGFKASYKSPVSIAPTNMFIKPGTRSLEDAVKTEGRAIILTSLQGLHSGANPVSGDFSLAASGYLIEDGKITIPVEQITVSGNFYDMLLNTEEVLSDLEFGIPAGASCCGSPSLVIKEMAISGK
jgi:PmbA protein